MKVLYVVEYYLAWFETKFKEWLPNEHHSEIFAPL